MDESTIRINCCSCKFYLIYVELEFIVFSIDSGKHFEQIREAEKMGGGGGILNVESGKKHFVTSNRTLKIHFQ